MPQRGSATSSASASSPPETSMNEATPTCAPPTSGDTSSATFSPASAYGPPPSAKPAGPTTDLFGRALAPASRSAPQAKDWVREIAATSGPSGLSLSASADLSRSLANRLRRRTDLLGSTLFNLTWKTRHTPAGRLIFALRGSARRTSDSGCGSSPTPMAGTPAQKGYNEAGNTDSSRKTVELIGWPTPDTGRDETLESFQARQERMKSRHPAKGGMGSLGPLHIVAQLATWPTPQSRDGQHSRSGQPERTGGRRRNLDDYATLATWATPTQRDHKDGACDLEKVPVNALLGRQVLTAERQAPSTASGEMPNGSPAQTEKRGQLRPGHSRWLMAIRAAWESFAPTGMRSAKKSPPSSSPPIST